MVTVLDAHALVAYFGHERGAEKVRDLFAELVVAGEKGLVTAVNAGEVYLAIGRKQGRAALARLDEAFAELPIEVVPADLALAKGAAALKATKKMSYADCFAAALAKMHAGRVVTGDPEFHEVEDEIEILWIQQDDRAVQRGARP